MFSKTHKLSLAAANFLENGVYTSYHPSSMAYEEFWAEEIRRCIEGYKAAGTDITGLHYFYLNYVMIKTTKEMPNGRKRKLLSFPRFLDMDYQYFNALEDAELAGVGMVVAKARRKGFSYKNAALCVHQAYFFRESTCIIASAVPEYSNYTFSFCKEMITHINKHAGLMKKRPGLIDRADHVKFGYKEKVDGIELEQGYKSEIFTLSFSDNPQAGIGKTADKLLFEEAGDWDGLIEAYGFMRDTFKDGDINVGMPIIFGTGGDMNKGTRDFSEMFYNPELYGLMSFENIWDKESKFSCGFFVPDYLYKEPYVDKDGNSIKDDAIKARELEINKIKESGQTALLDKYITQHPICPSEAFLQSRGNIFPVVLLQNHLSFLLSSKKTKYFGEPGRLEENEGKLKWEPDNSIEESPYPFKEELQNGCIVIYEHPIDGLIPHGLYIAGTDPYVHDKARSSDSVGSTFIYKRMNKPTESYDIIVAEYTGRPKTSDDYYHNVRKLLQYYNAVCLYENMFRDMATYFQNNNYHYLLADQPEIIGTILKNSYVQRGKGMHMNEQLKTAGEQLIFNWLMQERSPGVYNLHSIQSINFIRELISYNKEGNFDRVMSFMLVMYFNQEIFRYVVEEQNKIKKDNIIDFLNKRYRRN